MSDSVQSIYKRFTKFETELEVQNRSNVQQAEDARRRIEQITPDNVEVLKQLFPDIAVVVTFTKEQLIQNKNNECYRVQTLYNQLRDFADKCLRQYEEAI